MSTILGQQQIAAKTLNQPLANVISVGFVDPETNIFVWFQHLTKIKN